MGRKKAPPPSRAGESYKVVFDRTDIGRIVAEFTFNANELAELTAVTFDGKRVEVEGRNVFGANARRFMVTSAPPLKCKAHHGQFLAWLSELKWQGIAVSEPERIPGGD